MAKNHPAQTLQQDFRNAMASCAAGVHVITTDGEAGRYGITMTAVTSITDEPPTVMLCINRRSAIIPIISANRHLCINVLSAAQQDVAEHFAGITKLSPEERFEYHIWHRGQNGQLQVEGALAHLHGKIIAKHEIGTHDVFYVEIDEIRVHNIPLTPALIYFRRNFNQLI
ncbi:MULTISPECIES: 4-hydroxyphenylacetate 3-monooxygenase, reductase component [unclassified Neisseria]|uniref:4-hydroxyphenylacetate 3-monooxygenase, reductase component n=1 Tax=unclassified Neisseria TaxID=2623750 RepID=UPI002665B280|nr:MULTISPECIES: 4-hydroxyphenylacetate 3-monooxygenase, reductase component [unclassified Neisseria]MDO1509832.1 4-hydroxyphenylacetate 3-monooxygenase, reductase component [Neisseria sp. MVDL19-042950]MDO1515844.1 4-hydroxyphenylacetate 3-monooxygenase, reductase component [Neisseria sp. MVDL18-041461]MDO1562957.1 4-hydroxyphenylacetate 3-monooxygenase, reductase component [Neisseria sp. MVDL20-010259]